MFLVEQGSGPCRALALALQCLILLDHVGVQQGLQACVPVAGSLGQDTSQDRPVFPPCFPWFLSFENRTQNSGWLPGAFRVWVLVLGPGEFGETFLCWELGIEDMRVGGINLRAVTLN